MSWRELAAKSRVSSSLAGLRSSRRPGRRRRPESSRYDRLLLRSHRWAASVVLLADLRRTWHPRSVWSDRAAPFSSLATVILQRQIIPLAARRCRLKQLPSVEESSSSTIPAPGRISRARTMPRLMMISFLANPPHQFRAAPFDHPLLCSLLIRHHGIPKSSFIGGASC